MSSTVNANYSTMKRLSGVEKYLFFWSESEANQFEFKVSKYPLGNLSSVFVGCFTYLITIYILREWIRLRGKPFNLRYVAIVWNWFCSIGSLYLLIKLSEQVFDLFSKYSVWSLLCDEGIQHNHGKHQLITYIVYLTKYLELIDTFLLCLRGKNLQFLHVYHHSVTILFTYIHLQAQTCIMWMVPVLNLSVHVVMYAYFALYEMNINCWWKQIVTLMQVTQFYITLAVGLVVLIPRIIYTINPALPGAYACHGTWPATIIGMIILLSYLYLFQRLYFERYNGQTKSKSILHSKEVASNTFEQMKLNNSKEPLKFKSIWGKNATHGSIFEKKENDKSA